MKLEIRLATTPTPTNLMFTFVPKYPCDATKQIGELTKTCLGLEKAFRNFLSFTASWKLEAIKTPNYSQPRPQRTYTALPPLSQQQQTHQLANFPYNFVMGSGTKTWRYRKPTCHNCILGWKSGSLPQNIGPFVGDWKMCVSVDGGSNRSSTTWPLPWLSCLTIL